MSALLSYQRVLTQTALEGAVYPNHMLEYTSKNTVMGLLNALGKEGFGWDRDVTIRLTYRDVPEERFGDYLQVRAEATVLE